MEDPIYIKCPHCGGIIHITEINCGIFRHAVLIETGSQINPHSPKDICMKLYNSNKIYGCGMPFKLIRSSSGYKSVKCDWI